jgi:hypothetical protein
MHAELFIERSLILINFGMPLSGVGPPSTTHSALAFLTNFATKTAFRSLRNRRLGYHQSHVN